MHSQDMHGSAICTIVVLEAQAQALLVQLHCFPQRAQLALPQRLLIGQGYACTLLACQGALQEVQEIHTDGMHSKHSLKTRKSRLTQLAVRQDML